MNTNGAAVKAPGKLTKCIAARLRMRSCQVHGAADVGCAYVGCDYARYRRHEPSLKRGIAQGRDITASNHRADIDTLCAAARALVVGFHAFPELISAGFIGVDIFFVISGFLITVGPARAALGLSIIVSLRSCMSLYRFNQQPQKSREL
jgi:hypothetical protein